MTYDEFKKRYGTDLQCLLWVQKQKCPVCPKCKKKLYYIKGTKFFNCRNGHHTHPLVGTIFEKSTTPLHLWFLALYTMSETRSGVSAKALQRTIGTSYQTAWRMFKQIRSLMGEDNTPLKGIVECDECYVGGVGWFSGKKWWTSWKEPKKTIVLGMVERKGKVKTTIIPTADGNVLAETVNKYIAPDTYVITDGHYGYRKLKKYGYKHDAISHEVHYVDKENPHIHTQTIEGFWGQMKRGIRGVYRHVDPKYLQSYCDEYAFRYNHRNQSIFDTLVARIVPKRVEDIPF